MRNAFFALIFLLSPLVILAQSTRTEFIDGQKFFMHVVEQGNTLFGLQTQYGTSMDDIILANPGIEKGLQVGKEVRVPVPKVTVKHTVKEKETLFGLSKKYGVTVDQITAANPDVVAGLKIGQVLLIEGVYQDVSGLPVPVVTKASNLTEPGLIQGSDTTVVHKPAGFELNDSIISHTVLPNETLYSIAKRYMVSADDIMKLNKLKSNKLKPGDRISIRVSKEVDTPVEVRPVLTETVSTNKSKDSVLLFPKKDRYTIAILLPFNLDKSVESPDNISNLATEFYMGAQLAIDSLTYLGLKADIFIHDIKNDTNSLKKVLLKPEFKQMDLIIGPLFQESVEITARWCKEHGVRMICPVSANLSVLKGNPFVYNVVPTETMLMSNLAKYTLQTNTTEQLILVKPTSEKDLIMYEAYRNAYLSSAVSGKRGKLLESTPENFTTLLKKGIKSVVICPTNDKVLAMKIMNNLLKVESKIPTDLVTVYGTKEWVNFDDLKLLYKEKYHFHFASPNDLNYDYPRMKSVHKSYRAKYSADMSKMAVQGFDVVYYFVNQMILDSTVDRLIMNDFQMKQMGEGNGYENWNSFILKQYSYSLQRVK